MLEPLAANEAVLRPEERRMGVAVIDMGGGTTEAAVVSMNDIVVWSSVRVGGIRTDESIMAYVRKKYNLVIGEPTAEAIKIKIGAAVELDERLEMQVQGRDQVAGLPRIIAITKLDVLTGIDRLKICRGYRLNGKEIADAVPANLRELAKCEPVYEELQGWKEPIGWAKTIAGVAKVKVRGLARVRHCFTLAMTAYNLIRMPKLLGWTAA